MRKLITNIALIAGLVAMVWAGWKGCSNARHKNRDARRAATVSTDSVQYWRDMYGREHATREVAVADRRTLELFYKAKLDSARDLLKLRKRQLEDITDMYLRADGQVRTELQTVEVHDTVNGVEVVSEWRRFDWADEWMTITGQVDSASVELTYSMAVPVKVVKYWKRKWWLGRKRQYVDVSSENPNVTITELESLRIR